MFRGLGFRGGIFDRIFEGLGQSLGPKCRSFNLGVHLQTANSQILPERYPNFGAGPSRSRSNF